MVCSTRVWLVVATITSRVKEEFEDTNGAIRIRISKKNRQHNDQNKKYKMTNNDQQNIHIKLKITNPTKNRGWTKNEIGICCFPANTDAAMSQNIDVLLRIQDDVSEWNDMSTRGHCVVFDLRLLITTLISSIFSFSELLL